MSMHVQVYVCVCVCEGGVLEKRKRNDRYLLLWHACRTGIIWTASLLLSNATECLREMSPFHTDNRIWSKQKLPPEPIYSIQFAFPSPILIAAAWNTNKRYISGLLAGDKSCWNRKSLDIQHRFHFHLPTATAFLKVLSMVNFYRSAALQKSNKWSRSHHKEKVLRCI